MLGVVLLAQQGSKSSEDGPTGCVPPSHRFASCLEPDPPHNISYRSSTRVLESECVFLVPSKDVCAR